MTALAARTDSHRVTLGHSSGSQNPRDLISLTSWYAQANELEIQAEIIAGRIANIDQRLPSACQETALERTRRDVVAKDNMLRRRAISELRAQLEEARKVRDEEAKKRLSLERDIKGLARSLNRVQQQMGHAQNSVAIKKEQAAVASASQNASHVEEDSLRSNLQCMAEVQKSLAGRVTLEREKRLKLKAASRGHIAKVEENQSGLRQELGSITREVERWKSKLKDQQAIQDAVASELATALAKAREAEEKAKQAQMNKTNMQQELLEMQRLHEKLVTELDHAGGRLHDICSQQREQRELWQAKQLEKIDSRLNQRRRLDQEEIVARDDD